MTSPRSSIRVSPVFDPGSGGLPLVSELTPVFVSGYDLGRTVSSATTIGFSRCVRLWLLATALPRVSRRQPRSQSGVDGSESEARIVHRGQTADGTNGLFAGYRGHRPRPHRSDHIASR